MRKEKQSPAPLVRRLFPATTTSECFLLPGAEQLYLSSRPPPPPSAPTTQRPARSTSIDLNPAWLGSDTARVGRKGSRRDGMRCSVHL